ncbi:AMP-binding protein [Corynebacterium sp. UMB4614]|uniref:AMP-binding protein n=1 Tax=Corynebacterium sp. UMB4614 TaxID=3046334 RepID=UPI002550C242|nr:AMP-binding protein [Corynebacterium sp. UMB4614]MDK7134979.1 AMP-binding protein [Corynebacterium sp. UMB4614]
MRHRSHNTELASRGIGEGDVVTLQVPNSINFAASLLGILRAGAIVNPIGMLMNQADVEHIVEAAGAKLFIGPTNMEQLPQIFSMELASLQGNPKPAPEVDIDPDSVAAVPFSSGTTGLPKGVQLTHRNLTSNLMQVREMIERSGFEAHGFLRSTDRRSNYARGRRTPRHEGCAGVGHDGGLPVGRPQPSRRRRSCQRR